MFRLTPAQQHEAFQLYYEKYARLEAQAAAAAAGSGYQPLQLTSLPRREENPGAVDRGEAAASCEQSAAAHSPPVSPGALRSGACSPDVNFELLAHMAAGGRAIIF